VKLHAESKALTVLAAIRAEFAGQIRAQYEHRAQPCATCKTPGACCLDEHFVNVRISRLEAVRIGRALDHLPPSVRKRVWERIADAIDLYGLRDAVGRPEQTFACPLFEQGTGCLVHDSGKPVPCVMHACYEKAADLPPDSLQDEAELGIARLNDRVYGREEQLLPIPVALKRWLPTDAA